MSTRHRIRQFTAAALKVPQQIIHYLGVGVNKIFSPTDDQYPRTGVQPFEGDPADKKASRQ
jgi:hypothetical protein